MIKAIAFDLDNTLIDFWQMKKKSCDAAARAMIKHGLKANRKKTVREIFHIYDTKGYEYQEVFTDLIKKFNKKLDFRILGAGVAAYQKVKGEMLFPYPDVKPVLKKLRRKYKLAIVTDSPRLQPFTRLAALGILQYFDTIVTFDDTHKHKPDLAPFRFLLKKLKLKPNQVMFVGDSPRRDMSGARAVGMVTVFAKYGLIPREREAPKADYTLSSFKDLLQVVRKANRA
jgi:putative hydrolase of the HAD superfamily